MKTIEELLKDFGAAHESIAWAEERGDGDDMRRTVDAAATLRAEILARIAEVRELATVVEHAADTIEGEWNRNSQSDRLYDAADVLRGL